MRSDLQSADGGDRSVEADGFLRIALAAAEAKKAIEPVILDTTRLTPIFDYFLICSGQTAIQVKTIADHLEKELERAGLPVLRKEGAREGRWVLLDYGWLVVHVMQQHEREFYQLERLWHDAERRDLSSGAAP